jgi:phosphoenolpyruvate carboxylase
MDPLKSLNNIEKRIQENPDIDQTTKAELLRLLATLKSEIAILEHTHAEHAESVIGLAERSMHEAIRQPKDPQLAASALQELAASVAELEVSHPQLVNIVNAISVLLANIGI